MFKDYSFMKWKIADASFKNCELRFLFDPNNRPLISYVLFEILWNTFHMRDGTAMIYQIWWNTFIVITYKL